MKQFRSFIKKEFYHILRDKRTMFILLGMPIVQIIIFGFALTNEVKNAKIAIFDQSNDAATQALRTEIEASSYFDIGKEIHTYKEIEAAFKSGAIRLAVIFPQHFDEDLKHFNKAQVQLIAIKQSSISGRIFCTRASSYPFCRRYTAAPDSSNPFFSTR